MKQQISKWFYLLRISYSAVLLKVLKFLNESNLNKKVSDEKHKLFATI